MTSLPYRDEQARAWELRAAWVRLSRVVLRLTDRCEPLRISGYLVNVSPTGATARILRTFDGEEFLVAVEDVLSVRRPHHSEPLDASDANADRYRRRLELARRVEIPGQIALFDLEPLETARVAP